jgi:hypothetical protein
MPEGGGRLVPAKGIFMKFSKTDLCFRRLSLSNNEQLLSQDARHYLADLGIVCGDVARTNDPGVIAVGLALLVRAPRVLQTLLGVRATELMASLGWWVPLERSVTTERAPTNLDWGAL